MPVHSGRCLKESVERIIRVASIRECPGAGLRCSGQRAGLPWLGSKDVLSCCLFILPANRGNKDGSSVTDIKGLKVQGEPCVWCAGG